MNSDVATYMNIPKFTLKENIMLNAKKVETEIYNHAENHIFNSLKEMEPNAPDEMIRAFIKVYFEINISCEYDIKTNEYNVICTPTWKDPMMINRNSKEYFLLNEYMWNYDMNGE